MTTEELSTALGLAAKYPGFRACNIADISCDVGGGLEFMNKSTTISSPFFKVKGLSLEHPPVQIMSVDILPASIPLDASMHFSGALMPYVQQHLDWCTTPNATYPDSLAAATIAVNGQLTRNHKWLYRLMASSVRTQVPEPDPVPSDAPFEETLPLTSTAQPRKKILMLGSGMVAQPAVDMIARREDVELIIGLHHFCLRQNSC